MTLTNKQLGLNYYTMQYNIDLLLANYSITKSGYFGERGKSSRVRVIKSSDQFKTAKNFWGILSLGGKLSPLPNKNGVRVRFNDGSFAVYRIITSTKNSPAIEITIKNSTKIKSQKIPFVKGEFKQ